MDVTKYDQHIEGRLLTSSIFIQAMTVKNHRRRKFQAYQEGQQAVTKLAAVILEGVENPSNVVVAWGNGSFGPTSRGHASAPNKSLRKSLGRFFPIVLVNEYNTSKKMCCCRGPGKELRTVNYQKKRATVLQCPACHCVLSRDFNAAMNILAVFKYQVQHQTSELPEYLRKIPETHL